VDADVEEEEEPEEEEEDTEEVGEDECIERERSMDTISLQESLSVFWFSALSGDCLPLGSGSLQPSYNT
jgi:hypothetical protein